MCGIAGAINVPLTTRQIKEMFQKLAARGRHATGIAILGQDDHWRVWKVTEPADMLVRTGILDAFLPRWVNERPKVWLFHTRQATHGAASEVNNAHPITSRNGLLIHNGIVRVERRYPARGQTDTEQLLLDIDRRGYRKALETCGGYYAIAYSYRARPDWLLLAKSTGASLAVFQRVDRGQRKLGWTFASTVDIAEPLLNSFSFQEPLVGGEGLWVDVNTGKGKHEKIEQNGGGGFRYAGMGWDNWEGTYYQTAPTGRGGSYDIPHAVRREGELPELRERAYPGIYGSGGQCVR